MNKLAISVLVSLLCASASIGSAQAAVKKAGTRYAAPAAKSQVVKRSITIRGRNKIVYQRVTKVPDVSRPTMGDLAGLNLVRDPL
ncbi:MAG TPA: peptidase S11, partial [Pseudoduganella sp.]